MEEEETKNENLIIVGYGIGAIIFFTVAIASAFSASLVIGVIITLITMALLIVYMVRELVIEKVDTLQSPPKQGQTVVPFRIKALGKVLWQYPEEAFPFVVEKNETRKESSDQAAQSEAEEVTETCDQATQLEAEAVTEASDQAEQSEAEVVTETSDQATQKPEVYKVELNVIPQLKPKLPTRNKDLTRWKATWLIVEKQYITGKSYKAICEYLARVNPDLKCSEDTLRKIIEAGLKGYLKD